MIVSIGKYYLYRHIRLDKNEPFYIGIGTRRKGISKEAVYERAYTTNGRNKIWHRIYKKNTNYHITQIVIESDNYDFIKEKEIEFIKLYGKICDGTGILANLSDGGEGASGCKWSEESKLKVKGKTIPQERKDRISKTVSEIQLVPIYQYTIDGNFIREWKGIAVAKKELKISGTGISACSNLKNKTAGGFIWRKFKVDKIEGINPNWKLVKLFKYDLNWNLIKVYDSIQEAAKIENTPLYSLYDCTRLKIKIHKKHYWISENKIKELGLEYVINYLSGKLNRKI